MPQQSTHEARGLVLTALAEAETPKGRESVHPGVAAHLTAARVHLDAACALLTFGGTDAP